MIKNGVLWLFAIGSMTVWGGMLAYVIWAIRACGA